jgi:hypothetical protein
LAPFLNSRIIPDLLILSPSVPGSGIRFMVIAFLTACFQSTCYTSCSNASYTSEFFLNLIPSVVLHTESTW